MDTEQKIQEMVSEYYEPLHCAYSRSAITALVINDKDVIEDLIENEAFHKVDVAKLTNLLGEIATLQRSIFHAKAQSNKDQSIDCLVHYRMELSREIEKAFIDTIADKVYAASTEFAEE